MLPGCPILNVTDDVCGEETCTPGAEGYTCGEHSSPNTVEWRNFERVIGVVDPITYTRP
ncbi:unnamed protein product [Scytosiphon promiscuus]